MYLLILIFLGGVIILILYLRRLSLNEKFLRYSLNISNILILSLLSSIILNKTQINFRDTSQFRCSINQLYIPGNFLTTLYLIIYLVITIVCAVKLVKIEKGPLVKRL